MLVSNPVPPPSAKRSVNVPLSKALPLGGLIVLGSINVLVLQECHEGVMWKEQSICFAFNPHQTQKDDHLGIFFVRFDFQLKKKKKK